jgi:hypothetical protein
MKKLTIFGAMGILLLSSLPSAAQQRSTTVHLRVMHDGHERPAPDHITLSFGDHSLRIPIREGKFEIPPEFVVAHKVTLATDVDGDRIRLSSITGEDFTQEDWTLLLADRAYDGDYQWAVPKGTNVRASCMMVFDSVHSDPGRVLIEQHCRSKNK